MLIFAFRGQTSQIVVALMISFASTTLFINWKPYLKKSDNRLAIVSQVAIFFTLFYALLTKVEIDEDDKYDQSMFGYLLIFVNVVVVILFVSTGLVKPWGVLMKKLSKKHLHQSELKGPPVLLTWKSFSRYFHKLIESEIEQVAWIEIKKKEWGMSKKKAKKWLDETGARGEWRSSSGDGPIDQMRVDFEIDVPFKKAVDYALKTRALPRGSFESEVVRSIYVLGVNNDESHDDLRMINSPSVLWQVSTKKSCLCFDGYICLLNLVLNLL